MSENDNKDVGSSKLGPGGWFAVVVLMGFLVWACWYAARTWSALGGVGISTAGWVFIVVGVLLTVGLGAGLMALVFYSSRENYDR